MSTFDLFKPLLQICRVGVLAIALSLPGTPMTAQDDVEPLTVAYIPIRPYAQLDSDGERAGFLIELARAIGAEISVDVKLLDVTTSQEFIQSQIEGTTQMIAGVARLPPLEATNVFSDPVATETLRLVVASENSASFSGEVRNRRIGVVPPAVGSQVAELLARNETVDFATPQAAVMDLISGGVEAILLPNPAAVSISRAARVDDRLAFVGDTLRTFDRVIAVHESRADLLPEINAAIATLEANGRLAELRRRYFIDAPASPPNILRVGVAHSPPFAEISENGAITGFAVDVFKDLAERSGLTFEFVVLPLEDYFSAITDGLVDMLPFVLGSPTLADDMDLTLPITIDPVSLFVRDELELETWRDLLDKDIAMKSDVVDFALEQGIPRDTIVVVDDDNALVRALADGSVDGIIDHTTVVETALSTGGLTEEIVLLEEAVFSPRGTLALRFGLGEAREKLNAVIPAYILSDRFSDLRATYFGDPIFWTQRRLTSSVAALGVVVLMLVGTLLLQRRRRRNEQIAQQERDLAKERAHSETLKQLVSELEISNQEQAEFTYAISHDLKSPTNTMGMLIDELGPFVADEESGHDVLGDMRSTNRRMGQLITDVLDYSRIVEEDLQLEPIDLNAVVDDILEDLASDIAEANASVTREALPNVNGHPMQIRVLLQNLIANAVKFRSPERAPLVKIVGEEGKNGVQISVIDNGIGIPADQRDTVFGLFKRVHKRSKFEGTGLGLAICRRVMMNHGGTISTQDGIDGGAAFDLRFNGMGQAA